MILFVETSWNQGSLGLLGDFGFKEVLWEKKSSHSEVITEEFLKLLRSSGGSLENLNKIVIDVGPGSFTGIRVGLSFVSSLSYSKNIPITALNSLEVMAFRANVTGKVFVSIPAIKGHFYAAAFEKKSNSIQTLLDPTSLPSKELEECKENYLHYINSDLSHSSLKSSDLADFYQALPRTFTEDSWKSIKPLYLRRSEAEEKLSTGLLKPVYLNEEHPVERQHKPKSN